MGSHHDMGTDLIRVVAATIERDDLIPPGPVVLAFSGGPDSLCLLHLLADLAPAHGWRLIAAHLDHSLRPESEADVERVAALAATRNVPFRSERVDVWALASRHGWSIEEAGRLVRYAFLARLAREEGGAPVATGHNQDDQAETLLLHLARGAGLAGLRGMQTRTLLPPSIWGGTPNLPPLVIIRPLLQTPRSAIEAELAARQLTPMRDPSNTDPAFRRNRLRHELLPTWRAIEPGISAQLARTAEIVAADEEYLHAETERIWPTLRPRAEPGTRLSFERALFLVQPLALRRRLLRHAITLIGGPTPTLAAIDAALTLVAGPAHREAHLAGETRLHVGHERVWLGRPAKPPVHIGCDELLAMPVERARQFVRLAATDPLPTGPSEMAIDAVLELAAGRLAGDVDLGNGFLARRDGRTLAIGQLLEPVVEPGASPAMTAGAQAPLRPAGITRLPGDQWAIVSRIIPSPACATSLSGLHAHFTVDLVHAHPTFRTWRPGDRIALPGMTGHKKLSDFFIDRKVPRTTRASVPLLTAHETIAWVVGYAVGESWRAHDQDQMVLCCLARPVVDGESQPSEGER